MRRQNARYRDAGRRKPRAASRSAEVLKANREHIGESELLVSIFNGALEQGCREDSAVLRQRLNEYWNPLGDRQCGISAAAISDVFASWRRMWTLWHRLPIGGTLDLAWSGASYAHRSHGAGRRRRERRSA